MTLQTVPLSPIPNQAFSLVLNDRNVTIRVRSLGDQTYIDVTCEGVPICAGRACRDRVLLTPRAQYLGFPDLQLFFADLRGTSDPSWRDFGSRFLLLNAVTIARQVGGTTGPTPRPPTYLLLANGKYVADGSQFANGVVTNE